MVPYVRQEKRIDSISIDLYCTYISYSNHDSILIYVLMQARLTMKFYIQKFNVKYCDYSLMRFQVFLPADFLAS